MNLLRVGEVVVVEPPIAMHTNLFRTFSSIPIDRMMKAPQEERTRLFFLLAWLHVVVQGRQRYGTLGEIFYFY